MNIAFRSKSHRRRLSGSGYLLRDNFTSPLAAGSVDATAADPGPGTRAVVDVESKLSISAGALTFAAQATPAWGECRYLAGSVTRAAGRLLVAQMTAGATTKYALIGFDNGADEVVGYKFNANAGQLGLMTEDGYGGGASPVIATFAATAYDLCVVMRTAGAYLFIKGGAFTNWTLLWIDSSGTSANMQALIMSYNMAFTSAYIRIPDELWLPTPLAYDGFTRANGAIGSTPASGPESQYMGIKTWTGATWTVDTNKAKNTPTLGGELIVNGDFAAWTTDDPDSWTVDGEVANDPEVSEAATGEAHADTPTLGGGMCNIYTSDGTFIGPYQNILTLGNWYAVTLDIDTRVAGGISAACGTAGAFGGQTSGSPFGTARSTSARFEIKRTSGPTDITVDNASVKQLTLSTLFASLESSTSDVLISADITLTAFTQAGIVINLDDAATPANFIIAYHDGTNAKLEKCVAGTYTSVISASATYGAGNTLVVVKDGTSYTLFYNNVKIGSTSTISDAGIVDNTLHGIFSTYADNRIDNFLVMPCGGGAYSKLDDY